MPHVDHAKHHESVDHALKGKKGAKARFLVTIEQMAANYNALPTLEEKDAAVQDALAHVSDIAEGIFGK